MESAGIKIDSSYYHNNRYCHLPQMSVNSIQQCCGTNVLEMPVSVFGIKKTLFGIPIWKNVMWQKLDFRYGASVKDYWTIGFGTCYCSNPSAFPNGLNSTCTRKEALKWLKEEADKCYNKIKTNLTNKGIVLSSHQMDALSSFSFNCGENALFGSSLYKYIIQGGTDANKIKTYFRMWNKANGQVSKGLDRRRIAEAEMFSYGVYNNN